MAVRAGDRLRMRRLRVRSALALAVPLAARAFDFTFGPIFEYDTDSGFHAFRPLYSHAPGEATDVVWPIATHHVEAERRWWRAAICYGFYENKYDMDAIDVDVPKNSASSVNVFPLWFSGIPRDGEPYWAAFPFYGTHPHFLMMYDLKFALWPLWMS